jgi:hypothetical protein
MKTKTQTKPVFILADCHGIEGFDIPAERREMAVMRASLNRQRHAIVFSVDLTDVMIEKIKGLLAAGEFEAPLKLIKGTVGKIGYPAGDADRYHKSFGLIPNPALDPWRA